MDPQQRLLLEVSYRALENAGIPIESIANKNTGVFTGSFTDDFKTLYQKDVDCAAPYAATGITTTLNANRLSWFYNLKGPSINVDTACSSSLVALDQACRSLQTGDSDMGIVTGVNLLLAADLFYILSGMNMLSPDSRCMSFDSRGNGYGRGEGIGVLIVKRLSDALCNNDTIRAVIRSSGTNQDGMTPGITQPSPSSQEALIRDCYRKANIDLSRTGYFEAHGTGTPAGDPIEAEALGTAFRKGRPSHKPLIVGAVKSNIGHLEGASGIAGVIKSILVLENAIIPPNADLQNVNARIDEDFLRIKLPRQAMVWPDTGLRRASVNSFGFGGSNAHVVLDDAYNFLREKGLTAFHVTALEPPSTLDFSIPVPAIKQFGTDDGNGDGTRRQPTSLVLLLSASDKNGLKRLSAAYDDHLTRVQSSMTVETFRCYLKQVAYTLSNRRSRLPWKAHAVINDHHQALPAIEKVMSNPMKSKSAPKTAFVFTGQGAQWARMGVELVRYPVFVCALHRAKMVFKTLGSAWDLMEELFKADAESRISEAELSQPLCTALQIALVHLTRYFSIRADAVLGHSSGEIAAAFCAGAISEEAALRIAYFRGVSAARLSYNTTHRGTMLATGLNAEAAQPLVESIDNTGSLVVACHNSPKSSTVSGPVELVERLKHQLDAQGIFARILKVNVAYHSPQMQQVAQQYMDQLGCISEGEAPTHSLLMLSTVTGQQVDHSALQQPNYWVKNLVSPVKFSEAFSHLCIENNHKKIDRSHLKSLKIDLCVELGPHSALMGPIRDIFAHVSTSGQSLPYFAAVERNKSAVHSILTLAGDLECHGASVDLFRVNHDDQSPRSLCTLADLPEYPFDHSNAYWHESRVSKNLRLNDEPKLDLLGKRVSDWNSFEARWKNTIRLSELPWVEDHKINGTILYPAAGMIVMAIEALRQTADPSKDLSGYALRNVDYEAALTLSSGSVDVEFFLHQAKQTTKGESLWSRFRLFALLDSQEWTEICSGEARREYEVTTSGFNGHIEDLEHFTHLKMMHEAIDQRCQTATEKSQCYETIDKCGLNFGPAFQSINHPRYGDGCAVGEVQCFNWAKNTSSNPHQSHVVHPCTLDGLIQMPMIALSKGGSRSIPSLIPRKIKRVWIANQGLQHTTNQGLHAVTDALKQGNRGIEASVSVMDNTLSQHCAELEGMQFAAINEQPSGAEESINGHMLCNFTWFPDMDLASPDEIFAWCRNQFAAAKEPTGFYTRLTRLLRAFLRKSLSELQEHHKTNMPAHLQKYVAWAASQTSDIRQSIDALDKDEFDKLTQEVEMENAQGKVYATVGRHLPSILRGEVDALELLFGSEMMDNHYLELSCQGNSFKALEAYLSMYAHKNPSGRYLEIGAGTGGTTSLILQSLLQNPRENTSAQLFSRYCYTDISQSFFEKAREKYKTYNNMDYCKLNIEEDPRAQGFEAESFDVIVAANVLHATSRLDATLMNVRQLLRPGGKLILYEITMPKILRNGFIMGLLPGWWLSTEDLRTNGPCISRDTWSSVLVSNQFSGVETQFKDFEDERCHELSVLVSTKVDSTLQAATLPSSAMILSNNFDHDCATLQRTLMDKGISNVEQLDLCSVPADDLVLKGRVCFILERSEAPILRDISTSCFESMKRILVNARSTTWISLDASNTLRSPDSAMAHGLGRVLRNERPEAPFVTIALESHLTDGRVAENICKIALAALQKDKEDNEPAYEEYKGLLHISRLTGDRVLSDNLRAITQKSITGNTTWSIKRPLKLSVGSPGILDTLQFVEDDAYDQPLADDEVEIQVFAMGMNFKDCLIALGQVDGVGLGNETAGIVSRCGQAVPFQVGDRVCMSTTEGFKTFARSKYHCVCKLPADMSFTTAAAIPTQFVTAWSGLVEIAHLGKGESILIHAGAGGTGQAAIQIAQHIGAEVFATVGSAEKRDLLVQEYGVKEANILYSRDISFAKGIKRLTDGKGVDVVLNSLAGEGLFESWSCLAPYGRFVEIGKKDILSNASLPMLQFNKSVSFSAFDGSIWMTERPQKAQKGIRCIMDMFERKVFRTAAPLHVHDVCEIRSVFRKMADGKSSGKAVLSVAIEESIVPATIPWRPDYDFADDKTYIVAGGLGGVGRTIAKWMIYRGARKLLLLSRSGTSSNDAKQFVDSLKDLDQEVHVLAPPCDISNKIILSAVIAEAQKTMGPVAGCIQASMVLRDGLFADIDHSQWSAAISPKVQGSWNLHEVLPNLDFFVMFSSVSGIVGQRGQANYAAGNTYIDMLARHRVANGQKAVSIDLGAIISDGFLAENESIRRRFLANGIMVPLSRDDIFALLEYYCNPKLGILSPQDCQVVVGVNTPQNILAAGRDLPDWMYTPLFRGLHNVVSDSATSSATNSASRGRDFRGEFIAASSATNSGIIVAQALLTKLIRSLTAITEDEVDLHTSISSYGVDSLLAVELRTWLGREFAVDIPIFEILGGSSFATIGTLVAMKSNLRKAVESS